MKKSCEIKPNFNSAKDGLVAPGKVQDATTAEEAIALMSESLLSLKARYATNIDESSDPENFVSSIRNLIEEVTDIASKIKFKNKEMNFKKGSDNSKRLQMTLAMLSRPKNLELRDEEADVMEVDVLKVIDPLYKESELKERDLDTALNRFLKPYVRALFKDVLRERLAAITRIDIKGKTLITNIPQLNESIEDFLQENFSTLVRYLKSVASGLEWQRKTDFTYNLFSTNHVVTSALDEYLTLFEHLLDFKKRIGTLQEEVERGYNFYQFEEGEEEDAELLNALFAFLTLKYFDPVLENTVGNFISYDKLDKNRKEPIYKDKDKVLHYKYKFGKDTDNRVKGWGPEMRDALKELGNYSKFLIQLIEMIEPETLQVSGKEKLRVVDYFLTMTLLLRFTPKFRQFLDNSKTNKSDALSLKNERIATTLYNSLMLIYSYPVESMKTIMSLIHEAIMSLYGKNKKKGLSALMDLLDQIFNSYELKVLESIYHSVFDPNNASSFYNIETLHMLNNGLNLGYPIVETLVAQVLDSSLKNYLETMWNSNERVWQTSIKKKFNTNKMLFDMVDTMNISNQTNVEETDYKIINKYKTTRTGILDNSIDSEVYVLNLNGLILKIIIPTTGRNMYGLFSDTLKDVSVKILSNNNEEDLEEQLSTILASLYKERKAILNSNTGINKTLMSILKFIDIYTGTSFTAGEDGLHKYYLMSKYEDNSITKMLSTALKGFYINSLNNNFIDIMDKEGYTVMDFLKYVLDNHLILAKIESIAKNKDKWNSMWKMTSRGPNLVTASTNVKWIDTYAKVLQILSGEIARANIKNVENNTMPNYGLTSEGSNPWILMESKAYKNGMTSDGQPVWTALSSNPFTKNPQMILDVTIDTDVALQDGREMMVKGMTASELYYHGIVDKFFIPFIYDKMYVQPTAYADKTTFYNYLIDLNTKIGDLKLATMPIWQIENEIVSSIGTMYTNILNKVLSDYTAVYPELLNITNVNDKVVAIENIIRNKTEEELTADFSKLGLKLETDTHFRHIRGKKLAFNELLLTYATEVYTAEGFRKRMAIERKTFVRNLFETLTSFLLGGESNPIRQAYNKELGVGNDLWQEDGKLILAKNELDLDIHNLKELDLAKSITINPLLDRYLVLHSYLGNNLRFILSGNELNHKNKLLSSLNIGERLLQALKKKGILTDPENNKSSRDLLLDLIKLHPELATFLLARILETKTTSKKDETEEDMLVNYWNSMSLLDMLSIENLIPNIKSIVNETRFTALYEVEAFGQGALLKRNVIIPGTMRPYTLNSLKGIPSTFRVAIVMDTPAETFNVNGDRKSDNDAHDGSAWICPISSILENWSLQENEVGTVKKPIWHDYNGSLGTAVLVKFAAHTITNNIMRQAHGGINMLNIFKKMTNKNWNSAFGSSYEGNIVNGRLIPINIFDYGAFIPGGKITFDKITNGNSLYYRGKKGIIYSINDVGYENGVYYTIESEYNEELGEELNQTKVYHYFDENSNHIKSTNLLPIGPTWGNNYHQMHSIYELYQLFGGLNSMSLVNDKFEESEASLYATASTINLVSYKTDLTLQEEAAYALALDEYYAKKLEGKKVKLPEYVTPRDQLHYALPLKTLMVDYIINNSAIKNGAGNRNNNNRLYNDEDFDTITLNTQYYGIQMDADHPADEAEMREFSQVISALDAGGRLHSKIADIYNALGDMAIRESQDEYEITKAFLEAINLEENSPIINELKAKLNIKDGINIADLFMEASGLEDDQAVKLFTDNIKDLDSKSVLPALQDAKDKWHNVVADARDLLYTIIGSVIINNISTSRGLAGLAESILREIKSKFSLKSSHKLDTELKIPFSDPNIYSQILSSFSSLITKKSIRRPYPGIGGVLSPGYNIIMIYDLDGKTYLYNDVLKEAILHYNSFLNYDEETGEQIGIIPDNYKSLSTIEDDTAWNNELVRIYLEEKRDQYNSDKYYYNVVSNPGELPDFEYYTETFMPTDRIGIKYGNNLWYDLDLDSIETYYNFKQDPRAFLLNELLKKGLIKAGEPITIQGFRKNINIARNLAPTKLWWTYEESLPDGTTRLRTKNIYDTEEVRNAFLKKDNSQVLKVLDEVATGVWKGHKITVHNNPAELVMSNIYQSRFNIGASVSLVDILNNKGHIFKDRPIRLTVKDVKRDFYDFVMLRSNGRHSYISFDRGFVNPPDSIEVYKQLYWGKKQRKPSTLPKVVNDVYILDLNRHSLFMIGRDIIRDDIIYVKSENKYYTEDENGKREQVQGLKLSYDGEKVTEYVEFVTQHNYRKADVNHLVYNINTDRLKDTLRDEDGNFNYEEYYNQVLDIIQSIYLADSYECLTLNNELYSIANSYLIRNLMKTLYTRFNYDYELSSYLKQLYEDVILKGMITPTRNRKTNKWEFNIESSSDRLGLIEDNGNVLVGKGSYAKRISNITKDYYKYIARRKQTSFERSLRYTASRIPAQTLQSFMLMQLVGYTGEEGNYTYVSHWQTWLQGSDYDIDKAYIMGLAFDDNGSYVGWSNLFDYYDIDTLYESEKLPMPKLNVVITDNNKATIDINPELSIIQEVNTAILEKKSLDEKADRIRRLKAYQAIFSKLGNNTIVKTIKDSNRKAFAELNSHFSTKYPPGKQSLILRNFISSHILSTILDVRNLKDSYIPVEMKDLRKAADNSPKGLDAKTITLLNPLSIYKMLRLNMIGKNVIGIAATGQKASFMLSFYMNEAYKNVKEGVDFEYELGEDNISRIKIIPGSRLDRALFSFTSKRLINNPTHTVKTIPDLNFEGVIEDLKNYARQNKLSPVNLVDIMISLLISAATDNAKELILDKINAGDNLAKCFLFGIVMGIDVKTLVEFMTSPVISWINTLSSRNLYLKRENLIDVCADTVETFLKKMKNSLINTDRSKPTGDLTMIIPNDLSLKEIDQYLDDIAEFRNLVEAADEFSSLGRNLSINQGIKTRAEDLEAKANNIQKIIADRERKLSIISKRNDEFDLTYFEQHVGKGMLDRYESVISNNFNVVKWLLDGNIALKDGTIMKYRELTAEYYDHIKKVFNVFDIINNLPHFNKMFSLMGSVFSVYTFPARTRLVQAAILLYKNLNSGRNLDESSYTLILSAANDMMLIKFFEQSNIRFPVLKNQPLIKADGTIFKVKNNTHLDLSTDDGRARFKYIFEDYVIPKLKSGTLFTPEYYIKDNMTEEQIQLIRENVDSYNNLTTNNDFIISLIKGRDGDIPIWKTGIDMSSDNVYSLLQIAKLGKALLLLHSIKLGNYSIADWFAIYNFIVNKNYYGSDRLTKAFEVFINTFNGKRESVINEYFDFVGNIDYEGQDVLLLFDVNIYDMLMLSARVVESTENARALMVIKDFAYYEKASSKKGDYKRWGSIAENNSSYTLKEQMDKYVIRKSYYTLSKPFSSFVNRVKSLLNSNMPYKGISHLMLRGNLIINLECQ